MTPLGLSYIRFIFFCSCGFCVIIWLICDVLVHRGIKFTAVFLRSSFCSSDGSISQFIITANLNEHHSYCFNTQLLQHDVWAQFMTHIQKKTQTIMLREAGQHQGSVSHLVLFVLVFTVRSDLRISHMIICLLLNINGNMKNYHSVKYTQIYTDYWRWIILFTGSRWM